MNDFGTAIIFFVAFLVIAFLRSGDVATIALACAGTGFAGVLALRFKPYALKRFSAWGHVGKRADDRLFADEGDDVYRVGRPVRPRRGKGGSTTSARRTRILCSRWSARSGG